MLTPRKKMTRKELHKDPLLQKVATISDYAQEHQKRITYVLVGIVIAAAVAWMYIDKRNDDNAESLNKLAAPERIFQSGDYREAIKRLEKYCAEYDGSIGGGIGTYYLAVSYLQTDQFDFALENFQKYVDDYADNEVFTASSMAGMASCYEALNKYDEACRQYERVISKFPGFFLRPTYMMSLSRCYRLTNQPDQAREWLDKIVKEYPETNHARDAKIALEETGGA